MKKFSLPEILLILVAAPLPVFWLILWPSVLYPATSSSFFPSPGRVGMEEFLAVGLGNYLSIGSFLFCLAALLAALITPFCRKTRGDKRLLVTILLLATSAAWFASATTHAGTARESSRRQACRNTLTQLNLVLRQYAGDYQDDLPPDLKVLFKNDYLADAGAFRCPSVNLYPDRFTDYLYLGAGHKIDENPPFILLEDRPDNHPGTFRNRLYSDGKIENCYPGAASK